MPRYVIVGSGAAGFAAAEMIRRADPNGEILLVSEDPFGYYSRPGLAYYLTQELTEDLLYPVHQEYFKSLGVKFIPDRITHLDPDAHHAYLSIGQFLTYDRLLIAVGASAAPLKVPGSNLNGVVKLDSLQDAQQIEKLARRARNAVVVGGGITALELVEGLVARRVNVHYFLRGERYWSNVLDEAESSIVEHRLTEHSVKVHYNTELEEILGKKGRVAAVRTTSGEIIRCDVLGYAIGIRPRLELAKASGLEFERGIFVDEFLHTSAEDVFAAGDVAQVYDPFSGKRVLDSLWNPAKMQGKVAGQNMAGSKEPYYKGVPFNVTRLAGLTTTIIGAVGGRGGEQSDPDLISIARGDSETWRELPDAIAAQTGFDVNRLRVFVGENKLLGAVVMGDQTLSNPLQMMVDCGVDISSIRSRLLAPGAPLADILIDYYKRWKVKRVSIQ